MNPSSFTKVRTKLNEFTFRLLVRTKARSDLVRLGSPYGGFWVPMDELTQSHGEVAYSAGVGEDISFDEALVRDFNLNVWCFDPTPRSIAHMTGRINHRLHFEPIGLWSSTTELRFYAPVDPAHVSHSAHNIQGTTDYFVARCETVDLIMSRHGHNHIKLLKMNIEGAESEVIRSLADTNLRPSVLIIAFEARKTSTNLRQVSIVKSLGYQAVKTAGHTVTFVTD